MADPPAGVGSSGKKKKWTEIDPKDATGIILPHPDIEGPLNEMGQPCPWPWDPIQLKFTPLGQYHCPYCLAMVVAGMDHVDYREGVKAEDLA